MTHRMSHRRTKLFARHCVMYHTHDVPSACRLGLAVGATEAFHVKRETLRLVSNISLASLGHISACRLESLNAEPTGLWI